MKNINNIAPELKELGVGVVYLFGSTAENKSGHLSDIDLGVLLKKPAQLKDSTEIYNKLYDLFTEVFDVSDFKIIDIVFLQRASLELKFDVVKHGKVIFEDSEGLIDRFEHNTQMQYMDFKPILNMFNRQVINRI